jgi:hypothetical protein
VAAPPGTDWSADEDLLKKVDAKLVDWWQGDFVEGGALFHLADPARPLTELAEQALAQADESHEVIVTEDLTVGLVAITQTCDIRRPAARGPMVHFARLVEILDDNASRQAREKKRPRFVHVPGRSDHSFADLEVVITVEKSVVAEWTRHAGCSTDAERRAFTDGVRRKWSRFAFPDDVVETLEPLVDELDKHDGKNTALGNAVRELEDIRLLALSGWSETPMDLVVYFILSPATEELTMPIEDWRKLVGGWIQKCKPVGDVRGVEWEVARFDEIDAYTYSLSDQLDTDNLSAPNAPKT